MTVAKFTQPDFTTMDPTMYKGSIDAAFSVAARLIASFSPRAQDTPDMTVHLEAGHLFNAPTLTEVAAQDTGLFAAPGSNSRKDIIYVDELTGLYGVVTGTSGVTPSDPAIPGGKIPVARVTLTSSDTVITNSMIDDLRTAGAGGSGSSGVKGSDVASATSITLPATGDYFKITGSTQIETLSARPAGRRLTLTFASAPVIKNSAALILQDGKDYQVVAGDTLQFISDDGANWRQVGRVQSGNITAAFARTGIITPAQITSNQNDYNPTGGATSSVWRISSDTSRNITGIGAPSTGRRLTLINIGSSDITLKSEDSGSLASNRLKFTGDFVLSQDQALEIEYDVTSNRWRPSFPLVSGLTIFKNTTTITLSNGSWPVPSAAQRPGVLVKVIGGGGGAGGGAPDVFINGGYGGSGQCVTGIIDLTGVLTVSAVIGGGGSGGAPYGGAGTNGAPGGGGSPSSFGSYLRAEGGFGGSGVVAQVNPPYASTGPSAAANLSVMSGLNPAAIGRWAVEGASARGPLGDTGANSGRGGLATTSTGGAGQAGRIELYW